MRLGEAGCLAAYSSGVRSPSVSVSDGYMSAEELLPSLDKA